MSRRALREATLVPGASLRGLVFDACAKNYIPNTYAVLRYFGMPNRNRVLVSESPHLDVSGLANALRIDPAEILLRRYPLCGQASRSFYGMSIAKTRIEYRVRRFSPAAIADNHLHHPATHELRDLPFSTVGWDILQTLCPCTDKGVRQGWITVNGTSRCDACGGSLGKIEPVPVPDHTKEPLALVAGLVDPNATVREAACGLLPLALQNTDRALLYDMIINLARATSSAEARQDPIQWTEAIAASCSRLIDWPTVINDDIRSHDCSSNLWAWILRHHAILDVCEVQAGNDQSCSSRPLVPTASASPVYETSGSIGKVKTQFIGAMAAARLSNVDEHALKKAWDDGQFTQHVSARAGLRVRAFDPSEVLLIAPLLRVTRARSETAKYLGLPVYGVEQLLARRLLNPQTPNAEHNQSASYRRAADDLVAEFSVQDPNRYGKWVNLSDAVRHVSGRPKPWATIVESLLADRLPYILKTEGDLPFVRRIRVPEPFISFIANLTENSESLVVVNRAERWTQRDALELLNGNLSNPAPLDGLESTGTRKLYRASDILERAKAGATTSDLARRFGYAVSLVTPLLRANKIPEIVPGFWQRSGAEEVLGIRVQHCRSK